MIKCTHCKKALPPENFSLKRNSRSIMATRCDKCRTLRAFTWNERNPERMRAASERFNASGKGRTARLKAKYGLSEIRYSELLASQNGGCAICGAIEPGGTARHLHVDHDHATGKVRGLLCTNCNRGLGYFCDDVERLQDAAEYLRQALTQISESPYRLNP